LEIISPGRQFEPSSEFVASWRIRLDAQNRHEWAFFFNQNQRTTASHQLTDIAPLEEQKLVPSSATAGVHQVSRVPLSSQFNYAAGCGVDADMQQTVVENPIMNARRNVFEVRLS